MPIAMSIDHAAHEAVYRKLRGQAGLPAWNESPEVQREVRILEGVMRWPVFPSTGRLLEMGCGAGNIALFLAGRGWTVTGVDIAPTAIEWARENAAKQNLPADFRVGDVLRLDGFTDGSFDVVLDGHCLHCIVGDERGLFFASALRLLRAGGFLCVRTLFNEASRYPWRGNDIVLEVINAGFDVVQMVVMAPDEAGSPDEMLLLARKPG